MDTARFLVSKGFYYAREAKDRYEKLGTVGKAGVWGYIALHVLGGVAVVIITPARMFEWLALWAQGLRDMTMGWLLLLALIIITSMPPLLGYGTCVTLCGFAFGVWEGWFIAMTGCIIGAMLSFLVTRRLISLFAPLLARDKTFVALAKAVRVKGLPLVILIRLCPFPFPYSNAFFASIETVTPLHFLIATAAITPKLLLHVWVGSRLYLFADPTSRTKMDTNTKLVNAAFVIIGGGLGAFTSWYLYQLTMKYVAEVTLEENEQDALEAGLLDDVDELLAPGDDLDDFYHPTGSNPATSPSGTSAVHSTPSPSANSRQMHTFSESKPVTTGNGAERMSEDHWEQSFSDFGDNASEDEREGDIGGGGREEVTRPSNVHTVSMDKRID